MTPGNHVGGTHRKRRRKPSDLPPLSLPSESEDEAHDAESVNVFNLNCKHAHPHIWGIDNEKRLNVAELDRDGTLQRTNQEKMHYVDKTNPDKRFVLVFMDETACKSEREFTDISEQYGKSKRTTVSYTHLRAHET